MRDRGGDPDDDDLGFTPKPMVNWFGPGQLASVGLKAVLAGVLGSYTDQRELQAALCRDGGYDGDYSAREELWFDYVADTGDGFNPTFGVASLLGRESLELDDDELPRGRILLMGGDQVYPDPSREAYRDRLVGPFRAALPWADDPPDLYAIPGNHDWYDGLTSFTRLFCQSADLPIWPRWIGAWRTCQRRSYFALKLPNGWWLWGVDVQLTSDIDKPQLEFFDRLARQMKAESGQRAPRLILLTARPDWVLGGETSDSGRVQTLSHFEDRVIRGNGVELTTVLAGDLHHYSRYERQTPGDGPQQRITAGGGGAYLLGTHRLPEELELVERRGDEDVRSRWESAATWPTRAESRRLAFRSWFLTLVNPAFATLIGGTYALLGWVLEGASRATPGGSLVSALRGGDALEAFVTVLAHSPSSALLGAGVVSAGFGLAWFQGPEFRPRLPILGLLHGLGHVGLVVLLMWAWGLFGLAIGVNSSSPLSLIGLIVALFAAGGFTGSGLFVGYLQLASLVAGAHTNEIFSAQRIEDYKCFLRMHVDAAGRLTIHPLGLRWTPRRWRRSAASTGPRFEPVDRDLICERIEAPIVIEPDPPVSR